MTGDFLSVRPAYRLSLNSFRSADCRKLENVV